MPTPPGFGRLPGARFARHMGTRIERCSIIDNDNLYPAVLYANAEMKFVRLTSGPRVFDDIAKNLVERDLKLHHCFAWDVEVLANAVERRSDDREVNNSVAN